MTIKGRINHLTSVTRFERDMVSFTDAFWDLTENHSPVSIVDGLSELPEKDQLRFIQIAAALANKRSIDSMKGKK